MESAGYDIISWLLALGSLSMWLQKLVRLQERLALLFQPARLHRCPSASCGRAAAARAAGRRGRPQHTEPLPSSPSSLPSFGVVPWPRQAFLLVNKGGKEGKPSQPCHCPVTCQHARGDEEWREREQVSQVWAAFWVAAAVIVRVCRSVRRVTQSSFWNFPPKLGNTFSRARFIEDAMFSSTGAGRRRLGAAGGHWRSDGRQARAARWVPLHRDKTVLWWLCRYVALSNEASRYALSPWGYHRGSRRTAQEARCPRSAGNGPRGCVPEPGCRAVNYAVTVLLPL